MKRFLFLAVCVTALLCGGCASTPKVAYRTIGTAAVTAEAAINAWGDWVRAGYATKEQEAVVKDAFEKYQAAMRLAKKATTAYFQIEAKYKTNSLFKPLLIPARSELELALPAVTAAVLRLKETTAHPAKP